MQTQILCADEKTIPFVAEQIRLGQLVAIPTETVYGLAANGMDSRAVEQIFVAKGRPQDNPLILHIATMQMWSMVVDTIPNDAKKLAKAFWPGPLTIILPHNGTVAKEVTAGLDTVAVRMPNHPVALQVILQSGVPLAAPSANLSGSPSPTTAQHVLQDMNEKISCILDGGSCQVGLESTVIGLDLEQPVLLRPGYITKEQMETVLQKKIQIADAVTQSLKQGQQPASPGMKYKHYAPKACITIIKAKKEQYYEYVNQLKDKQAVALCFAEDTARIALPYVVYGKENDPASQSKELFSALRKLDEMQANRVYARCPDVEGIGLAVYNRLLRAAGFRVIEL